MHNSHWANDHGATTRFKDSHDCTDSASSTRCSRCKAAGHRRQHRNRRKVTAHAIDEGRELAEMWDAEGEGLADTWGVEDRCWDDYEDVVRALRRLGLVYDDPQDRGPGLTLDTITRSEREFSLVYKPLRAARLRQCREKRRRSRSRTPSRGSLSPALSFVDITEDEQLAAFLAVYDFVDLGDAVSEE